jgi:hypothetical protein
VLSARYVCQAVVASALVLDVAGDEIGATTGDGADNENTVDEALSPTLLRARTAME